jgi:hypothetical protein
MEASMLSVYPFFHQNAPPSSSCYCRNNPGAQTNARVETLIRNVESSLDIKLPELPVPIEDKTWFPEAW